MVSLSLFTYGLACRCRSPDPHRLAGTFSSPVLSPVFWSSPRSYMPGEKRGACGGFTGSGRVEPSAVALRERAWSDSMGSAAFWTPELGCLTFQRSGFGGIPIKFKTPVIGEGRARAGSEGAWARGFSQGYLPRFDVARRGRQRNGRGEYRTVLSRLDSHGA